MSHETGLTVAQVCGPFAWGILHHVASTFPCAPCAEEGARLMKFAEDFVQLKIGKPLKHGRVFAAVLEESNLMFKARGRPVRHLEAA